MKRFLFSASTISIRPGDVASDRTVPGTRTHNTQRLL
jgi:hypothetical protein